MAEDSDRRIVFTGAAGGIGTMTWRRLPTGIW